jgi:serine/threonine protein kinase
LSLPVNSRLGPYEIKAPLGWGGMGEVYRARDSRLERDVAIKVLHEEGAASPERRARFEREARAVAALNHPNIVGVFDFGIEDRQQFIVSELVDGESLRSRLSGEPFPVRSLIEIATQIADGLAAAHAAGVVHRDLKPENIMLAKDGRVKILDFGLARHVLRNPVAPGLTTGETAAALPGNQHITAAGQVLGTASYMSPEQAIGKEVDYRSDQFSFGLILHEMATGKQAFVRNSAVETMAAIVRDDPPPIEQKLPAPLQWAIDRCLHKDAQQRYDSTLDLYRDLRTMRDHLTEAYSSATLAAEDSSRRRASRWRLAVAITSLIAVLLIGILAMTPRMLYHREQHAPLVQLEIAAPDSSEFSGFGSAISPDGQYVAFVAITHGKQRLWLRALDSQTARPLEDTDDAQLPFWAPDSKSIGFFARDKLKRCELTGGSSRIVAHSTYGTGGTWNRDGVIVYASKLSNTPLWRVAASGGVPVPATVLDSTRGDARHNFPQFLPDGRHFLFLVYGTDPQRSGPYIGSLGDPNQTKPIPQLSGNPFQAVFVGGADSSSGYLIYAREGALIAQSFDTPSLRLKGEPESFLSRESLRVNAFPGFLNVTASVTGTLLDGGTQRDRNELVWRKRDGTLIEVIGEESDYIAAQISRDGSRIAVTKADPNSGGYDMWIEDWGRKLFSRFTFQRGMNAFPVWAPDGRSIIYTSDSAGLRTLYRKDVAGSGPSEQLLKNSEGNEYGFDLSPDGHLLLFTRTTETDRGDIWMLPLNGNRVPFPYLKTPAGEFNPQFSPGPQGGKWVIYESDESSIDQIYVRRFTGKSADEARWQISSNGGRYPRWRGDGSDIVYLGPDGKLMSTAIHFGADAIEAGRPTPLFDAALPVTPFLRYPYDVSRDGQKILVLNAARGRAPATLRLVLNWAELLKR